MTVSAANAPKEKKTRRAALVVAVIAVFVVSLSVGFMRSKREVGLRENVKIESK